jgi:hypothetical protein
MRKLEGLILSIGMLFCLFCCRCATLNPKQYFPFLFWLTSPKMAAAPLHVDPIANDDDVTHTVSVSLARLQHLEACELRADLQDRHIQLLQKQVDETGAALKLELARGEKHAEAMMHIARSCDDRVDELKMQHAAAMIAKDDAVAALKAELETVKASHAAAIGSLEGQVAVLQAQTTSKLTDIHAAIAAMQTLEVHAVRPDQRQFAEWHIGPVPPLPTPPPPSPAQSPLTSAAFDRAWCLSACGMKWKVEMEAATSVRAHVMRDGDGYLTLRRAAPLSSPAPVAGGRPQLPTCRVVVEAYDRTQSCRLGFVAGGISPLLGQPIRKYGGWTIVLHAASAGHVGPNATWSGWTALNASCSVYCTTSTVPAVPAGSAVEFSVDYVAGTCRVAFYTPAAVAGEFMAAPYAKMELRFVATDADAASGIPARSVPTLADPATELYPAAETSYAGATWRFAA